MPAVRTQARNRVFLGYAPKRLRRSYFHRSTAFPSLSIRRYTHLKSLVRRTKEGMSSFRFMRLSFSGVVVSGR